MERLVLLCVALALAGCEGNNYQSVYDMLNKKLSKAIPVPDDRSPVLVDMGLKLLNIDEVDKVNNKVDILLTKRFQWNDEELGWDAQNSQISSMEAESKNMWVPDIVVYNAAAAEKAMSNVEVLVLPDGLIVSAASVKISAMCDVSGVDSYSGATCELVLASWAYHNELLTLREPQEEYAVLTDSYSHTSKYEILTYSAKKEVRSYGCCKYENKFKYDLWVVSFTFREKAGGKKRPKMAALKALLGK